MSSNTDCTQTASQAFISGSLAGTVTPISYQALWKIKTVKQTKQPPLWKGRFVDDITNNMKKLHIGLPVNMINGGISFGVQTAVNNFLLRNFEDEIPSDGGKVISSCATGVITSPLSTFTENVMNQKGVSKVTITYGQVFKNMYFQEGVYAYQKGLLGTACREAVFVCAFACVAEYLSKKIESKTGYKKISDLIGGALAGVSGALVSQPFDTIKTKIQNNQPWKFKGLMQGGITRASYCGLAVAVYTLINERIKEGQRGN